MESLALRIIIMKHEDMFVAQCLEHDVSVQGCDMATVQRRFEQTIAHEGDGVVDLPPAPECFQEMWIDGLDLESKVDNAEMRLAA